MTVVTCARCGKEVRVSSRGPRPKYCGDACRQAAHRGAPGRPAADGTGAVSVPTDVTSGAQRPSGAPAPGLGDGDWCPQSADHGRMYFMKPAMARQWCPSSRHQGDAFYARNGVTPAPRPPVGAEPAPTLAQQRALDSRRATEAPELGGAGASTPTAIDQPPPARARADHDGDRQLPLSLLSG